MFHLIDERQGNITQHVKIQSPVTSEKTSERAERFFIVLIKNYTLHELTFSPS